MILPPRPCHHQGGNLQCRCRREPQSALAATFWGRGGAVCQDCQATSPPGPTQGGSVLRATMICKGCRTLLLVL